MYRKYTLSEVTTNVTHELNTEHEYTSIRVHKSTIKKLDRLGKFRESYGSLVDRIASKELGLPVNNSSDGGSW